jgi:hypothetical protein
MGKSKSQGSKGKQNGGKGKGGSEFIQTKPLNNQPKTVQEERMEEQVQAKMDLTVKDEPKIEAKNNGKQIMKEEEEIKEELQVEEVTPTENHEFPPVEFTEEIDAILQDKSIEKDLSQYLVENPMKAVQYLVEEVQAEVDTDKIGITAPQSIEEDEQTTETPLISSLPVPPTSPVTDSLEDQYESLTLDRGYRSVSPEKFMKEVSASEAPVTGIRYLIRSALLLIIQIFSRFHEVLEFLNDECKYEFGLSSSESDDVYSPFIQTWLIPHFINRNPSLKKYSMANPDFFECSLPVSRSEGVDDQNISELCFQPSQEIAIEEKRTFMSLRHDPSPSPTSSKDVSISSLSVSDDHSLSTSEFLLLMASYELVMACFWTSFLLFYSITQGCIFSLISKSLSICWMLTISSIQWMIWLILLPITIPLSLCKKMVLFLFPDINNKRHQEVSSSVCGTL